MFNLGIKPNLPIYHYKKILNSGYQFHFNNLTRFNQEEVILVV